MARPTNAQLQEMLAREHQKRARSVGKLQEIREASRANTAPQSPLPASTHLPPDYFDLKRAALGQGGATDAAVKTAEGWFGNTFDDLGRYRSEYNLKDNFKDTMWNVPLGGHTRAMLENMNMPTDQAIIGERIAAGLLSTVVGLPALQAAYDGLFGQTQSPGTMPITVVAGPPAAPY